MPDLPPDLPRLRALETYLRLQLGQVQTAIAKAEQEERARKPGPWPPAGQPPANPDPSDPRKPKAGSSALGPDDPAWHPDPAPQPPRDDTTPWWLLAVGTPKLVHVPGCDAAPIDAVAINRRQAHAALSADAKPCFTCQASDTLRPT